MINPQTDGKQCRASVLVRAGPSPPLPQGINHPGKKQIKQLSTKRWFDQSFFALAAASAAASAVTAAVALPTWEYLKIDLQALRAAGAWVSVSGGRGPLGQPRGDAFNCRGRASRGRWIWARFCVVIIYGLAGREAPINLGELMTGPNSRSLTSPRGPANPTATVEFMLTCISIFFI